jgi:putative oxidoreductase
MSRSINEADGSLPLAQEPAANSVLDAWAPRVLSILRIVAALLFLEHGLMKLFAFPAAMPGSPHPMPPIELAAGLIEVVGGSLLALGLFSRAAAFITSGEMAVAYFLAHAPRSFWPAINFGDLAILWCFLFFYFVFAGPGPWSVDAFFRRARR